jgi:hypothetical protein
MDFRLSSIFDLSEVEGGVLVEFVDEIIEE